MLKRLHVTTIFSEDHQRLLPFYRDVLGLPVRREAEGFVMLGPPGGPFVALGTHSNVHGPANDPDRHIVVFETDDLDAEHARLSERGVTFIEPPSDDEDGVPLRFASFRDPDGNILQIVQLLDEI
jgi:catechol 2,3-dioxygenase-like lactoylglutathione lyase family enzyme